VEALLVSTAVVALAEIGDKTQLLALLLAARYRQPRPIIAGIFVATIANHAAAGSLGVWLAHLIAPETMRWILGLSFLAMAAWMLVPDKIDGNAAMPRAPLGVFGATTVAFFLAEMADKTQIATIALAARFDLLWAVVIGTTLGMMIANVPAVLFGEVAARKLPVRTVHAVAALVFALLGLAVLWGPLPAWLHRS